MFVSSNQTIIQTNLKNNTKMGHWAQNQASAMAIQSSDLNPVENE